MLQDRESSNAAPIWVSSLTIAWIITDLPVHRYTLADRSGWVLDSQFEYFGARLLDSLLLKIVGLWTCAFEFAFLVDGFTR